MEELNKLIKGEIDEAVISNVRFTYDGRNLIHYYKGISGVIKEVDGELYNHIMFSVFLNYMYNFTAKDFSTYESDMDEAARELFPEPMYERYLKYFNKDIFLGRCGSYCFILGDYQENFKLIIEGEKVMFNFDRDILDKCSSLRGFSRFIDNTHVINDEVYGSVIVVFEDEVPEEFIELKKEFKKYVEESGNDLFFGGTVEGGII